MATELPVRTLGVTLLGAFFAVATLIAVLAGLSLLVPGPLDVMWAIKPLEHAQLAAWAPWSGLGFLGLGAVLAATVTGFARRVRWGWRLAVGVFAVNGLADAGRMFSGAVIEGLIGVAAASALLYYLARPPVRAQFG